MTVSVTYLSEKEVLVTNVKNGLLPLLAQRSCLMGFLQQSEQTVRPTVCVTETVRPTVCVTVESTFIAVINCVGCKLNVSSNLLLNKAPEKQVGASFVCLPLVCGVMHRRR